MRDEIDDWAKADVLDPADKICLLIYRLDEWPHLSIVELLPRLYYSFTTIRSQAKHASYAQSIH